jgi:hypothetical protein
LLLFLTGNYTQYIFKLLIKYYGFIFDFVKYLSTCKMDLQEAGWGGMDWIELARDRDRWLAVVNVVMNPWVP